jgi:hypothetical protein
VFDSPVFSTYTRTHTHTKHETPMNNDFEVSIWEKDLGGQLTRLVDAGLFGGGRGTGAGAGTIGGFEISGFSFPNSQGLSSPYTNHTMNRQ